MSTTIETPTILDVVEHHNGWVANVTSNTTPNHVTLELAFRNVGDKQHFMYAVRTAWTHIVVLNRPATVTLSIVVPLGV
jgi:hypothetical protein